MSTSKHPIGIIGCGAMGAGIAQVAAVSGWTVELMDVNEAAVRKAIDGIRARIDRLVEKEIITIPQRDEIMPRLRIATSPASFRDCDLVLEAIVEDMQAKTAALKAVVPVLSKDAVLASNTSSLSITKLGESIGQPQRVVGMHFFNPAPLMPLVEVVSGAKSSVAAIERVTLIAEAWGKTVVKCADTPGFIVNRVARPYYLEAFRIAEDGYAGVDEIDKAMRELGDFRMGPFELTDLIGQDVNAATTQSIWEQLGKPARLQPSNLQMQLVRDGHLGRKTKRGVYNHEPDHAQPPPLQVARRTLIVDNRTQEAVERFVSRATTQVGTANDQYVFARILVSIINEAAWALSDRVASAPDIDTAMKLGTNYPKGPLEWAEEIGYAACGQLLDALNASVLDNRFEAAGIFKARV
jgi:3-hydroxybutyryl-CoA dehydrogenase